MRGRLILFIEPDGATVTFRHDNGLTFVGVPSADFGRPAVVVTINEEVPNGHGAQLTIEREGHLPIVQRGVLWEHTNPVTGSVSFDVDTFRLTPNPKKPLAPLTIAGHTFRLVSGERFTAIQCSDFNLLARFAAGEDIRPILKQRAAVGFNMLRVWTLMHLSQFGIGDLDPCPYDRLKAFAALAGQHGLYVEFTAYTSTFDTAHWGRLGAAVQGCTNVILELVNENDQHANTIDTNAYAPIAGVLCSHGSNGSQAPPVSPFWQYTTFHTNDASEWQRKVGHNAMEIWNGPTLSNENTRYPDKVSSFAYAYDAAAGAALLCAGSCFHSVSGKRSTLWEGHELVCAQAWADGAKSVPLEFQDGSYLHREDLEGPSDLRVYERRLGDGRGHVVHIRK